MDFLNKAYSQFADLFRSMTPGARITSALLLVGIVCSLLFLFRYQTDRTEEYLFGGLVVSQSEIVAMEAALGKHGLNNYEITGNRLRVPRSQKSTYLAALAEESALPQNADTARLDMFKSNSPFDPKDIRELKARFAHEKELEHVVRSLKDIETATVKIIDDPSSGGFGVKKIRQAMVTVKPLGGKTLDEEQVRKIRHTVASGAGVKPEYVTVTDTNGAIYPGVGKEGGANEFQNIYASYQRQHANYYKQIILERLAPYRGVTVSVYVELDKNIQNAVKSYKFDEKGTPTESTTLTKESNSNTGDAGGRPGAVPNGAVGNAPQQVAATPTSESTLTENRENQKSAVGVTETTTETAALIPVKVSASIGVPTSYYADVWRMRNPIKAGEEPKTPPADQLKVIEQEKIAEIQNAVLGLLPQPPKGDNPFKPVSVVSFEATPVAEPLPPSLASNAFGWFAIHWQTLAMFGLAAFGIIFLRGMVRSAQSSVPPPSENKADRISQATELEAEEAKAAATKEAVDAASNSLKRKFQTGGRSLRDELTDLVREDPDAAANVLKLWISDAA